MNNLINTVQCIDAIELMRSLGDKSVDAYITDLPYGTTACSWDEIIPFAPMWAEVKRTLKPRGVFVTTASQPFTSKLVMSNVGMFRYEWIWAKSNIGGYMNAQYMPLDAHESVLVFSPMRARANQFVSDSMAYYPQGVKPTSKLEKNKLNNETVYNNSRGNKKGLTHITTETGFPKSILEFSSERGLHPTQKPVALYDYLIRTYTQPGDLVVDFCCGSGTTGVAAQQLGRDYIMGDTTLDYVMVARKRFALPYTPLLFKELMG